MLRDIKAKEITGVQIGTLGHKLWVCVDGECVLRVRSPKIEIEDMQLNETNRIEQCEQMICLLLEKLAAPEFGAHLPTLLGSLPIDHPLQKFYRDINGILFPEGEQNGDN